MRSGDRWQGLNVPKLSYFDCVHCYEDKLQDELRMNCMVRSEHAPTATLGKDIPVTTKLPTQTASSSQFVGQPRSGKMDTNDNFSHNSFLTIDNDEVEIPSGLPDDCHILQQKHEFNNYSYNIINDIVDSEMTKITVVDKTRLCLKSCFKIPEDPIRWTTDDAVTWFQEIERRCSLNKNNPSLADVVREQNIDGPSLCNMSEEDFKISFSEENMDVIYQCLQYWKKVPMSTYSSDLLFSDDYPVDGDDNVGESIRQAINTCSDDALSNDSGCPDLTDEYCGITNPDHLTIDNDGEFSMERTYWERQQQHGSNPLVGVPPVNTWMNTFDTSLCNSNMNSSTLQMSCSYPDNDFHLSASGQQMGRYCYPSQKPCHTPADTTMKRKGPGRPPKPDSEKRRKKSDGTRSQPILWEHLLLALEESENENSGMKNCLVWTNRREGEFKFLSKGKEQFALIWGQAKHNRKKMTYQKMARALRDYNKSNKLEKVRKKLHYRFILKQSIDSLAMEVRMRNQNKIKPVSQ
ncbi:transcription factor ets-4-like [Saccoglossus kowalevskii]